jgi:hypothetical protein
MADKNIKIRPAIEALEVNQKVEFPIDNLRTVRVTASDLGLIHGRRYSTMTDRDERVVIVTRVA